MMPTKSDLPPARTSGPRVPTWRELAGFDASNLRAAAESLGSVPLPPVNTSLVSPVGFDAFDDDPPGARRPIADLRTTPSGTLRIIVGRSRVAAFDEPAVLSTAQLAALRELAAVRVPFGAAAGPVELARLLRQLLVGGVPVVGPDLPLSVRRLLGPELGELIAALTSDVVADPDRREQWSVDARRLALLTATSAGGVPAARPTVTAVVEPDEPRRLLGVLRDLRAQTWLDLAVVVAAAEDDTLPARLPRGVSVVRASSQVEARRRALLESSSALATTVTPRLSYGPEHIRDLVLGRRYGGRAIAGVRVRRTYVEPLDLTVRAPGEPSERFAARLTAGTLLATPSTLLTTIAALEADSGESADGDTVTVGDDGYAIHDRNVHRAVRRGELGLDAVLRAGGHQAAGESGRTTWLEERRRASTPHRVDPTFASYFSRTDSRGTAR